MRDELTPISCPACGDLGSLCHPKTVRGIIQEITGEPDESYVRVPEWLTIYQSLLVDGTLHQLHEAVKVAHSSGGHMTRDDVYAVIEKKIVIAPEEEEQYDNSWGLPEDSSVKVQETDSWDW